VPVLHPSSSLPAPLPCAKPARCKERRAAQAPATVTTDLRSGSFFKSKAGIAALLIIGAGTAYAIYSASNDRIKSSGR
jgi:hypothetical protein